MSAHYNHKNLSADEYLEWLNVFLSILNDFTTCTEKYSNATMISFLRAAEHVFNHFINHRATYIGISSEKIEKPSLVANNPRQLTYDDLKMGRDEIADKIAGIIESNPQIHKRFKEFCDNLKEPRMLGCCL